MNLNIINCVFARQLHRLSGSISNKSAASCLGTVNKPQKTKLRHNNWLEIITMSKLVRRKHPSISFFFAGPHLVSEFDTIKLVSRLQQLRPEGGGDELGMSCQLNNHV